MNHLRCSFAWLLNFVCSVRGERLRLKGHSQTRQLNGIVCRDLVKVHKFFGPIRSVLRKSELLLLLPMIDWCRIIPLNFKHCCFSVCSYSFQCCWNLQWKTSSVRTSWNGLDIPIDAKNAWIHATIRSYDRYISRQQQNMFYKFVCIECNCAELREFFRLRNFVERPKKKRFAFCCEDCSWFVRMLNKLVCRVRCEFSDTINPVIIALCRIKWCVHLFFFLVRQFIFLSTGQKKNEFTMQIN